MFLPKSKGLLNDVIEDQEDNEKVQVNNFNIGLNKIVIEQNISFGDLVVEPVALRSQARGDKDLLSYDSSLAGLRKRWYDRHLRPDEVFKIMIDALENPSDKLNAVADDMWNSHGEWLSACFQVSSDGKELEVFLDPENIKWNGGMYIVEGNNGLVKCSTSQKFSLEKIIRKGSIFRRAKTKNIPLCECVHLSRVNEINPELVEFLYSRPYHRLPSPILVYGKLYLPEPGKVWPVGRCMYNVSYNFAGYHDNDYGLGASRGVRSK